MHVSLTPLVPVADAVLAEADVALLVAALGRISGAAAEPDARPAIAAPSPLAPASGAFNAGMAMRLTAWREE